MAIKPQVNEERSRYKSFSKKQLKEFQEVETWLKNIGLSSHNVYLSALRKLCSWCGKDPHELIMERDREIKSDDPIMRNGIRDMILDFRHHLESQGYAPKTINATDGAVRSFFTAVLGRSGMVNLRNYKNAGVRREKDLVPTLEELKKMLDVVDLGEKFRILFIAQTGMRVSDAVALRIGDIQRELDLGNVPLAIRFLPKKDRELIGERISFLGSDGVLVLKEYLKWREKRGEAFSDDSPLFVGRSKKRGKGRMPVTQQNFNETIRKAAKRIGLVNGYDEIVEMQYLNLLKLRKDPDRIRDLRDIIIDEAKLDVTSYDVWIDLPPSPSFREASNTPVRITDTEIKPLGKIFPTKDWLNSYSENKWNGHVFCPPIKGYREKINKASQKIFKDELGIEFNPSATILAKFP